ncbi:hypothetical protein AUEXF2481DRAFT_35964 [Aureobasidium subglaciale EXF-2481]|uniref:Uncharacterized protein n=1 Tax=Aureobasidium subglaciale (strain EXF-2481) TaxID=1043005 RepID=A0A074YLI2_AURSE|nr:uncharacterized protein AUEXF2481DRAFT_35964 [Aureobasidium subglaciale EXF-2481]KEQ98638.1 hypothetical protein AUEXF2481DRAFT_35964 [Aureobasidium subglaciale EXF-2481]
MPQISLSCLPIRANTPRFLSTAHLATVVTLVLDFSLFNSSSIGQFRLSTSGLNKEINQMMSAGRHEAPVSWWVRRI